MLLLFSTAAWYSEKLTTNCGTKCLVEVQILSIRSIRSFRLAAAT